MRVLSTLLGVLLVASVVMCQPGVAASPGNGLQIVGPRGETTPVVNEGGRLALKVVDASGNAVAVRSWSSRPLRAGRRRLSGRRPPSSP